MSGGRGCGENLSSLTGSEPFMLTVVGGCEVRDAPFSDVVSLNWASSF